MFGEKKKRIPGEFDAAFAGMAQGYSPLSQATASQGAIGNMAPVNNAVAAAPTTLAPKKTGLFGKGGVGRAIAGTIGDFLMQRSGMAPVYAPTMMQERQAAAQAAAEQRKRAEELADWRYKEDYKSANAAPDAFERALKGAGIDPASAEGQQLYRGRAEAMARDPNDEFVVVPIPGLGTYAGPRSGLQDAMGGAPQRPVGKLTPMGGGAGNSVGGF